MIITIDILSKDKDNILIEEDEKKEDKKEPSKPIRPEGFVTPALEIIVDN